MNREEYKELLSEYALGALDAEAARELETRLASDRELRRELEEFRETSALLAFAAPLEEPSPAVRSQILQKIKQTPRAVSVDKIKNDGAPVSTKSPVSQSNVVDIRARQNRTFSSYLPIGAAIAASLIAVVLAVSLYNAVNRNRQSDALVADLNQRLNQAEQKLGASEQELAKIRAEREILGSPRSIVASLNGTDPAPQASARFVFDKQTGNAYLFVEGLPPAPRGKAYQIWFITDPTKPAPGGVFSVDDTGKAVLHDEIPNQYRGAQIFAVTLEDEKGSPTPTSKPYLVSSKL